MHCAHARLVSFILDRGVPNYLILDVITKPLIAVGADVLINEVDVFRNTALNYLLHKYTQSPDPQLLDCMGE